MSKKVQPGSIIRATLRPQDLIPCFVAFLQEHGGRDFNPAGLPWPEDDDDWWDSEAAEWLLNEQLFDAMNDIAPEGYLFGAHEGDGSDFGFWDLEDDLDDEEVGYGL